MPNSYLVEEVKDPPDFAQDGICRYICFRPRLGTDTPQCLMEGDDGRFAAAQRPTLAFKRASDVAFGNVAIGRSPCAEDSSPSAVWWMTSLIRSSPVSRQTMTMLRSCWVKMATPYPNTIMPSTTCGHWRVVSRDKS